MLPQAGRRDYTSPFQRESSNRLCQPGALVIAGHRPSPLLQAVDRIRHHDRQTREFEHLEIVEVVTDSHHLIA